VILVYGGLEGTEFEPAQHVGHGQSVEAQARTDEAVPPAQWNYRTVSRQQRFHLLSIRNAAQPDRPVDMTGSPFPARRRAGVMQERSEGVGPAAAYRQGA
jgi:hypothetical protein